MTARTVPCAAACGVPDNAANPATAASAAVFSQREVDIEFSCVRSCRRREAPNVHDSRSVAAMAMAAVARRGQAARSRRRAAASTGPGRMFTIGGRPAVGRPPAPRSRQPRRGTSLRESAGRSIARRRASRPRRRPERPRPAIRAPVSPSGSRIPATPPRCALRFRRRSPARIPAPTTPAPAPAARDRGRPSSRAPGRARSASAFIYGSASRDGRFSNMNRTAVRMPSSPSFSIGGSKYSRNSGSCISNHSS
jgi:hypothetical protein